MIDDNKASYDEIKRKLKAKKKELESKYKAATEKLFYTNESKALFISFEDLKEFAISNNIKILPSFNDSLILYWVLETGVKVPFHYHDCEESIFIIKGNVLFEKKEQDQPLLISCKDESRRILCIIRLICI